MLAIVIIIGILALVGLGYWLCTKFPPASVKAKAVEEAAEVQKAADDAKKTIASNVADVAKKICVVILIAIGFSSCQRYDNTIQFKTTEQQGRWAFDSAQNKNVLIHDELYVVSPTWHDAKRWAGSGIWKFYAFIALGIVGAGVILFIGYKKDITIVYFLSAFAALAIGVGAGYESIDFNRWNMNRTITPEQYNALIQKDGNLHEFWDAINP